MIERTVRALERRTGVGSRLGRALRYVFPDHWTFLFGEIALYSFLVLVATGTFLTLFFEPSTTKTVYEGSYLPLQGREVSRAYASALSLSFDVDAGLLIRQTHHWAALVFVGSITVHLIRIFFTGAFRRPRDLNYYVGLTMLTLAVLEGYAGYSLLDDLLSGIGLAIGNGVALSIPVVGAQLATLIWDGSFPGSEAFMSRLFIAHVLVLPVAIATLLIVHLLLCWAALDRGIDIAEVVDADVPVQEWSSLADEIRRTVEREGFDRERGVFVQAFGERDLDAAVLRLPTVGFIEWTDPRMISTAEAVAEGLDEGGLLRRYSADDGLGSREGTFLPCSFWLATCLAHQGKRRQARELFDRASSCANDLGLLSEEFDPDGEMLGNFPQALTHLSQIEAALALRAETE